MITFYFVLILLTCISAGLRLTYSPDAAELLELRIVMPLRVRTIGPHMHGFERFFAKYVPVLLGNVRDCPSCRGVQVVATQHVPDFKVERVANVLAEYLDNDPRDGVVDDFNVVMEMQKRGATMVMFANFTELHKSHFGGLKSFDHVDVEADETGGSSLGRLSARVFLAEGVAVSQEDPELRCIYNPDHICDAALEQVFKLVGDAGIKHAYPRQFGTERGSLLAVTMDQMIGDCGNAFDNTRSFPNCTGWFHYEDASCDYSCLVMEYLHHCVASYNGEYAWQRADLGLDHDGLCNDPGHRAKEWELCFHSPDRRLSRKILKRVNPDAFALIFKQHFKIPRRFPKGNYIAGEDFPTLSAEAVNLMNMAILKPLMPLRLDEYGNIFESNQVRQLHRTLSSQMDMLDYDGDPPSTVSGPTGSIDMLELS
eukprot:gnl/TRDRNA2_/TRDRNA2_163283_c2_seq1.p1 gnl/TRDRNA2_/TRDRNA2_163283_c2~~gnl/TRDRNA2_/TRDRNA2_163283_c2_seq1.p1  ORF type:complete len:426 (-),score=47.05 gnl/TRDRNA2_/TRDRNA2_163283_c2_seq1:63-1340(-)